jgi:SHS2 domain-containing protein
METPDSRWVPADREQAYGELDHPADIFLEVYGRDLPALFENALFALYDQLAQLDDFDITSRRQIEVQGPSPSDALRALLSEALYLFGSEAFIAARAKVRVDTDPDGTVKAAADLGGEILDRERHTVLSEVKAVTYHQLTAEKLPEGGWRATVLFDV